MSTREDRVLAGKAVVARIVADDVRRVVGGLRAELEPRLEG